MQTKAYVPKLTNIFMYTYDYFSAGWSVSVGQ